MSNIRFSQLPTVVALKDSDILAISSPDTSTPPVYTSVQSPISQVAAKIVEDTTFTTSLNTTNKTVAGAINETLSNFANEYSTSSTYVVGDCVLYAGSLYQCTTAIPSGEAWDSTHWTQIKAVDVGSGGGGGVHYSFNEQIVGTWIDGSIVYEKCIILNNGSDVQVSNTNWTNTGVIFAGVDIFIDAFGIGNDGSYQGQILAYTDNNILMLQTPRNAVGWVAILCVRYTKSST